MVINFDFFMFKVLKKDQELPNDIGSVDDFKLAEKRQEFIDPLVSKKILDFSFNKILLLLSKH